MANDVTVPQNFGPISSVFQGHQGVNDELGQGVASSYGIVGYKGKVWSIRYQGEEQVLMRDDGDGPRNSIEVVLVKASPAISKIFYERGYVEGSSEAPDCWSSNGQVPDPGAQKKQSPTCATCPKNAWGSRVTEAGKQGKACSDSRRVAVVPTGDIDNELFGGPMLLRIPAASLKDLKAYGDKMNSYQYPYYAVATRVAFDPQEAYPKFVFSAVRPLNDEEAKKVLAMRSDEKVAAVLAENVVAEAPAAAPAAPSVPSSPFEQDQPAPAAPQPAQQPAQQAPQSAGGFGPTAPAQAAPAPAQAPEQAPQPQTQPEAQTQAQPAPTAAGEGDGTPGSFDDMLDKLL